MFVVPNPSGLNASYPGFEHKLIWYRRLRRFVERSEGMSADPHPTLSRFAGEGEQAVR